MRFVRMLAIAALATAAVCQLPALVVQNLSQARQQAWVFVGAPASQQPGTCKPQGWPAVSMPGGLAVKIDLPAGARAQVTSIEPTTATPIAAKALPATTTFAALPVAAAAVEGSGAKWSEWVFDEAARLVPHFLCWKDGWPFWSQDPTLVSIEMLGPALRVGWRTRIAPPIDLTLEGWWTFWPGQDVVDTSMQAIWATTATSGMSANIGELVLVIGERPVIDHAKRKGLPEQPVFYPEFFGGMWGQTIATARAWGRASRIQWTGALLCLAAGERWSTPPSDARHALLQARQQGPLCAVSGAWDGSWGALGELPVSPPGAVPRPISTADGDEYDWRPLGEFKEAGTTGEHPDYGCCSGGDAVVLLSPAAIHDYRWQVQAWGLRPTSNRESDGRPIRAADHPTMVIYNQRPEARVGSQDVLGWPREIPYQWPGSGFGSVDDQHRSDNLLVATFQLTRDPCIRSWIQDLLELEQRRYWPPEGAPISSPRDWGRTQLAWAHYAACGFPEARGLLLRSLAAVDAGAALRRIPQDAAHTVRTLSDNESKYGWVELMPPVEPGQPTPQPVMIRSWNPWQEGLAIPGLWACWRQTGDDRARTLAITDSETLVRHAFYQDAAGNWFTAYSVRWRIDDPGAPLPASSYWPAEGPNLDVFTYPCQNNMMGAVRIAEAYSADDAVKAKARAILSRWPVRSWEDAVFRAVRP